MKITTVGIDLAKNVFQLHAVDDHSKIALRKQLRRSQMKAFFVKLPPCLIGMEACGSAHHWARELEGLGHTANSWRRSSSNPTSRPTRTTWPMPKLSAKLSPVPICASCRSRTQSNRRSCRCSAFARAFKARTAQSNQIRGLLGEFGLTLPVDIHHLAQRVPELLEDGDNALPGLFRQLIARLLDHFKELHRQVQDVDAAEIMLEKP